MAKGARVYGRGKFEAHPNYVAYMHMIVEHPGYSGMPGAVNDDGRILWQVSSGRTTSFFKHYVARAEWWEAKADELGLPGRGKEKDRFSIAARQIHPTGYRACRLCGQDRNVGYYYLNAALSGRLNRLVGRPAFTKGQAIDEVLLELDAEGLGDDAAALLAALFPEKSQAFADYGISPEAFEETSWMRSRWLSPGFMANPPDRLDGFHDYCIHCREKNDPGRSIDNLRSYGNDRRAFQWWAEGDWALADALYNAAGPGVCADCGRHVDRVSPDHVGPLACGFKQLPFFVPTCQPCNSSKNRRMRASDVQLLVEYEQRTGASAASWQVRGLWDASKASVASDADAVALSTEMRALQDLFLRVLFALLEAGEARFLSTLLAPEYAFFEHEFDGLDPGRLTFQKVKTQALRTSFRESRARRSVRVAFEELRVYASKAARARKLRRTFESQADSIVAATLSVGGREPREPLDEQWAEMMSGRHEGEAVEAELASLRDEHIASSKRFEPMREVLRSSFYELGAASPRPF